MTTNDVRPQCKTCNMPKQVQDYMDSAVDGGMSFRALSTNLEKIHGIHIADTSIGNHYKNHRDKNLSIDSSDTPPGWRPSLVLNEDGTGEVVSKPKTDGNITDFSDILSEMGIDPDSFEVVGNARISKWQNKTDGEFLTSYRIHIQQKNKAQEEEPLPLLADRASKFGTNFEWTTVNARSDRTLVVVGGDFQVGKVGSRGNTTALINRMHDIQGKLAEVVDRAYCSNAVWMDAGDIIEGFENVKQQEFTNDLSLMEQIDLAHTLELEFIEFLSASHSKLDVMSVPSNHAAWRKGKDYLGKPSDDWGIHIARRIEKELDRYVDQHNISFHYADIWKKSLNLDVQGFGLGLVHGDDVSKPEGIEQWWMKQVHGAGPTAMSDILVHGHFHTFRANVTGRSLRTGAQKWLLGAPTMDNGSDWYANGPGGSDSDPGLLTFVIERGKGLTDLHLITP